MIIKESNNKSILTIHLNGELDESNAQMVRNRSDNLIEKNNISHFIYDFSQLSFMDSTGIGMILGRYKKLKKLGIPMSISQPNLQVMKIIRMTGLTEIINII